ncbi:TetR/AcrR family transcriptional regulator [Actinomadura sp. HBU206391]|uniref:TetR/AcrR family transcriptional regulator n=1 Tax=Actinomadura sp. HBU206391 TaxID=2731692 RepID=UPI001650564E|nr:TetR/AcrR family transcriptional regulator [Actinomadura sp. HBU206391]MBC6462325.1 TetR/AcrR family transcriptional regulator [Actinomadura sp. HBU206391]
MARPRTISDTAILAATGRAIARHGLPGLSLAMIAKETGLAPATLVQRFGSKRGLLLAFAEQAEPGARRPFQTAREAHGSPLAALRSALAAMASQVRDREELANHLTFLRLDLTDPEFHGHALTHTLAVRQEIADLLAEAVRAGELDERGDTGRLARTIQVTYNGALIVWALTGDGELPELLAETLDDVLSPFSPRPA